MSIIPSGVNLDHLEKNPEGLTDNVSQLAETPNLALKRTLFKDEVVLKEFNCYFPTKMVPRWKMVLLLICTLGLYGILLAYHALLRWCYRHRCCTPALVSLERGKLAVTSYGRIICWKTDGKQKKIQPNCVVAALKYLFTCLTCGISSMCACCCKLCFRDLCAAPIEFEITSETEIFLAKDIRQMSQFYTSEALLPCCCCCLDYECGIQVQFKSFYSSTTLIDVSPDVPYTSVVAEILSTTFDSLAKIGTSLSAMLESKFDLTPNENSLYIISGTQDVIYNGDIHAALETLCDLQAEIIDVLPKLPEVFVTNGDLEIGKKKFSDEFRNVTIVFGNGEVTIPTKWFPMLKDEAIITTLGQVYRLKMMDWVFAVLTLGIGYLCCLKKKKLVRSAVVLTNKRIIELSIRQTNGQVPNNLDRFSVMVTSFFPGTVDSGFLHVHTQSMCFNTYSVQSGLLTDGGKLVITFFSDPKASLPFAQAMHMTTSRERASKFVAWDDMPEAPGTKVTDRSLALLPMLPDEKIHAKLTNPAQYHLADFKPCCGGRRVVCCFNTYCNCSATPVQKVCSHEAIGCCFPWLPYFLTCGLRPFIQNRELYVTDTAIVNFVPVRNYGLCGFRAYSELQCPVGYCQQDGEVTIVWALISKYHGHKLRVHAEGRETWFRRLFKTTIFGRCFCPLNTSTFDVQTRVVGLHFNASGQSFNHDWNTDKTLGEAIKVLDFVQINADMNARRLPEKVCAHAPWMKTVGGAGDSKPVDSPQMSR